MDIKQKISEIEAMTDVKTKYFAARELANFVFTNYVTFVPCADKEIPHENTVNNVGVKRLVFEEMTEKQIIYFTNSALDLVKGCISQRDEHCRSHNSYK